MTQSLAPRTFPTTTKANSCNSNHSTIILSVFPFIFTFIGFTYPALLYISVIPKPPEKYKIKQKPTYGSKLWYQIIIIITEPCYVAQLHYARTLPSQMGPEFCCGPSPQHPQPMSHTRVHLFRPLSIYRKATHRIYVLFSRTIEFKIVIICISMGGFLYSHSLIVYYDFTSFFLYYFVRSLLFCSGGGCKPYRYLS